MIDIFRFNSWSNKTSLTKFTSIGLLMIKLKGKQVLHHHYETNLSMVLTALAWYRYEFLAGSFSLPPAIFNLNYANINSTPPTTKLKKKQHITLLSSLNALQMYIAKAYWSSTSSTGILHAMNQALSDNKSTEEYRGLHFLCYNF